MRAVAAGLLLLSLAVATAPAAAQELLGWWKRGLLPVELHAGDWVRYASYEFSEGSAYRDTLEVAVHEARDDGTQWISLSAASSPERTFLLVDPARLGPQSDLLDALRRVVRRAPDGTLVEEDVEARRQDRLVQRHFQDPFEDPELTRKALPDTTVAGLALARERVRLTETRGETTKMGSRTLVLRTELESWAELSPQLPVFGVWALGSRTLTTSSTEGGGRSRSSAPLLTESSLQCLEFGRAADLSLPRELKD